MKLTSQETFKVFAMYATAPFLLCYNIQGSPVINDLGIGYNGVESVEPDIENKKDLLVLTPLSKITDEHLNEVAKLMFTCSEISGTPLHYLVEYAQEEIRRGLKNKNWNYQIYQHLIQLTYAMPLFFGINHWANGKTAIELGIAIEKQ